MVRQLQPWFENLGKRQVKSPKVYFRDPSLLHSLLGITDESSLLGHPKSGASWEGFALEQVLQVLRPSQAYFWGAHSGPELDLVFFQNGKRYGVEVKFNEVPHVTSSMRSAVKDLSLEHLWIVYPGKDEYPVEKNITTLPLATVERIKADLYNTHG